MERTRWWGWTLPLATAAVLLGGCPPPIPGGKPPKGHPEAPGTKEAAGPSPSKILEGRKLHQPPPLASAADVPAFVDWAGASTLDEREDARKVIAGASANDAVAKALIEQVEKAQRVDHGRALLVLAILGEMKNPGAAKYMQEFAMRKLPQEGTMVDGEIVEQTAQAMLQGKAVDGLAYMRTPDHDKFVLEMAARHPSRIVRAEAINAYLWNHGDSQEARRTLAQFVNKNEALFIDRVRRVSGEGKEAFNARLAEYLKAHPEVVPPAPEKQKEARSKTAEQRSFEDQPPAF